MPLAGIVKNLKGHISFLGALPCAEAARHRALRFSAAASCHAYVAVAGIPFVYSQQQTSAGSLMPQLPLHSLVRNEWLLGLKTYVKSPEISYFYSHI